MNVLRTLPLRQRGTALFVAIVLLLLMSLITAFAVSVGVFEQQTSANDLRIKMVNQVADAALGQAREFLRLKVDVYAPEPGEPVDDDLWELCAAADTTFPCGAVPQTLVIDLNNDGDTDDANESNWGHRQRHYRFIGGVDLDGSGSIDDLEQHMLPLAEDPDSNSRQAIQQVGDFEVQYGVGALLCRIDGTTNEGEPARCTTDPEDTTYSNAFPLVARATIPGESASATVLDTVATYRLINISPNTPPIVAAGVVQGLGTATVVPNPNSGGFGVPISVWSRKDFDHNNGTWQTCQLGEYLKSGSPTFEEAMPVCDDCDCQPEDFISSRYQGGSTEGIDVLDVDGNTDGSGTGTLLDSTFFPCDLFQFTFGFQAREDRDGDGFCETLITADGDPDVPDLEEYLEANAQEILDDCSTLDEFSQGLIWVKGTCQISDRVGSPASADGSGQKGPVMLVVESGFKLNAGGEVFGIVFVRDPAAEIDPDTGGDAEYSPGGGHAHIYGSIVIEGEGTPNGGVHIIGIPKVLEDLANNRRNVRMGSVPGAWTDTAVSY